MADRPLTPEEKRDLNEFLQGELDTAVESRLDRERALDAAILAARAVVDEMVQGDPNVATNRAMLQSAINTRRLFDLGSTTYEISVIDQIDHVAECDGCPVCIDWLDPSWPSGQPEEGA